MVAHGELELPLPVVSLPVGEILPSYVHMFVNRLIRSDQRAHELVLYDFLVQIYGSLLARARKAGNARIPAMAAS